MDTTGIQTCPAHALTTGGYIIYNTCIEHQFKLLIMSFEGTYAFRRKKACYRIITGEINFRGLSPACLLHADVMLVIAQELYPISYCYSVGEPRNLRDMD